MSESTNTPKIWYGCLQCYNEGHLRGEWFDAIEDRQAISEYVKAHQARYSSIYGIHEEWEIFDREHISEKLASAILFANDDIHEEWVELLDNHDMGKVSAYLDWSNDDLNTFSPWEIGQRITETHKGEYETLLAYAEENAESHYPEYFELERRYPNLPMHFDYRALVVELEANSGYTVEGGHVWETA